mmetsp:Transcript_88297/g.230418  ORF Transcript_88297/g.230418 Transcript_88297/m.230418 type:complete len:333 (-) Transcript_88297:2-1000(-)
MLGVEAQRVRAIIDDQAPLLQLQRGRGPVREQRGLQQQCLRLLARAIANLALGALLTLLTLGSILLRALPGGLVLLEELQRAAVGVNRLAVAATAEVAICLYSPRLREIHGRGPPAAHAHLDLHAGLGLRCAYAVAIAVDCHLVQYPVLVGLPRFALNALLLVGLLVQPLDLGVDVQLVPGRVVLVHGQTVALDGRALLVLALPPIPHLDAGGRGHGLQRRFRACLVLRRRLRLRRPGRRRRKHGVTAALPIATDLLLLKILLPAHQVAPVRRDVRGIVLDLLLKFGGHRAEDAPRARTLRRRHGRAMRKYACPERRQGRGAAWGSPNQVEP